MILPWLSSNFHILFLFYKVKFNYKNIFFNEISQLSCRQLRQVSFILQNTKFLSMYLFSNDFTTLSELYFIKITRPYSYKNHFRIQQIQKHHIKSKFKKWLKVMVEISTTFSLPFQSFCPNLPHLLKLIMMYSKLLSWSP